jgi:hypothetical protein
MAMRRRVGGHVPLRLPPLLDTRVVVSFGSHLRASGKTGCGCLLWSTWPDIAVSGRRRLPQPGGWCRIRGLDGEQDQEVKAMFAPVIPESGASDLGPVREPGEIPGIALRGQDHSSGERQHTHLVCGLERVAAPVDRAERGRDSVRRLVQAASRVSSSSRLCVLPRAYTTWSRGPCRWPPPVERHCTGIFRRKVIPDASLLVEVVMQTPSPSRSRHAQRRADLPDGAKSR